MAMAFAFRYLRTSRSSHFVADGCLARKRTAASEKAHTTTDGHVSLVMVDSIREYTTMDLIEDGALVAPRHFYGEFRRIPGQKRKATQ